MHILRWSTRTSRSLSLTHRTANVVFDFLKTTDLAQRRVFHSYISKLPEANIALLSLFDAILRMRNYSKDSVHGKVMVLLFGVCPGEMDFISFTVKNSRQRLMAFSSPSSEETLPDNDTKKATHTPLD